MSNHREFSTKNENRGWKFPIKKITAKRTTGNIVEPQNI